MLKIDQVSTGYDKKQVLYAVSLEIQAGEIVLLAGSNGSGKSTLLKALAGLLPLWQGEVWYQNECLHSADKAIHTQHSSLLKKGLLYLPQKNNVFEDLTVQENLDMAGLSLDRSTYKQRLEKTLSIFTTLPNHLRRTPMKLSGGERQILLLAMANLHEPTMLLIDEPFTGLSEKNMEMVISVLNLLNQKNNTTLLLVEHRVKECVAFAHRVVGLKLGKVLLETTINEQFTINQLQNVFV